MVGRSLVVNESLPGLFEQQLTIPGFWIMLLREHECDSKARWLLEERRMFPKQHFLDTKSLVMIRFLEYSAYEILWHVNTISRFLIILISFYITSLTLICHLKLPFSD